MFLLDETCYVFFKELVHVKEESSDCDGGLAGAVVEVVFEQEELGEGEGGAIVTVHGVEADFVEIAATDSDVGDVGHESLHFVELGG